MTISVYQIADPSRKLRLFTHVHDALQVCELYDNAILFLDSETLEIVLTIGDFRIVPTGIEEVLLGHIGYIGKTPIVTDKFATRPVLPANYHRGAYVSFPPQPTR